MLPLFIGDLFLIIKFPADLYLKPLMFEIVGYLMKKLTLASRVIRISALVHLFMKLISLLVIKM